MSVLGIDISHYQGNPNFAAVKADNVDFVFHKVTESTTYVDPTFRANTDNARAAGLNVGFYHFARATNAAAEAEFFVKQIGALQHGDLLALDWEIQASDPVGWSLAWLKEVERLTGVKPLVYLNQSGVNGFDWTPVVQNGNGLWLAKYDFDANAIPAVAHWPVVAFKQYSDRGNVAGVNGGVDLDVFNGDIDALVKYGFQGEAPAPPPAPTPPPPPPAPPTPPTAWDFPLPHTEYFGLITGPKESHGGINPQEKVWVKQIQQKLIELGFVPGIHDPNSGWADGVFQQPTADAVAAWQHAKMPGTTKFGEVWFDDWAALIQNRYPQPQGDPNSLPTMAFGETSPHVADLQRFLNAYNWRPALPLLPVTGYYGPSTAAVLHHAGQQLGVQGDADGRNFGPHFKAAFWRIGFRG